MATLNLSTNGPSIAKSYRSVVDSPAPSGPAASSPSYGQWAVFSVSAPLANAFQQDSGGKESVLKVQSTGEGELSDLIDEFSDGRIMFAFVKVKDPNTSLPKCALIGWCGEGVPERTKGYFTSHLAAVEKILHGYHVQITARSDRDLTPEIITQKISDASGSKYSVGSSTPKPNSQPPPVQKKPAFMPTQSSGGASAFNPLSSSRRTVAPVDRDVDEDGWGSDAPQVTRTQLEKVKPAYQPTRVNISELSSQKDDSRSTRDQEETHRTDVVKGTYQPIGKVDIASLRKQAQQSGAGLDDRPTVVKGAYEPVGKVDIAAIRARAQQPQGNQPDSSAPVASSQAENSSLPIRSSLSSGPERLTALPKPKVANRFGSSTSTFAGTTAPLPGAIGGDNPNIPKPPVGVGRTFADEGGKTPAQLWAEKKARQQGSALNSTQSVSPQGSGQTNAPISAQASGGGGWKSGYAGKSWAPVQTTKTGQSATSTENQTTEHPEDAQESSLASVGGVGAMRDMFKGSTPMGASSVGLEHSVPSPPVLDTSSKPNASRGVPIPGFSTSSVQQDNEDVSRPKMPTPPAQPRSPTPEAEDSGSPIRIAMPISRNEQPELADAHEEQFSPPPAMPVSSLAREASQHDESAADEPETHDAARAAAANVAESSFGHEATKSTPAAASGGKRALIQYDYEKAEDNELQLREGEYVTNIEMVDEDWWMGENSQGETGLFPSNYVELVEDDGGAPAASAPTHVAAPAEHEAGAAQQPEGKTATALYDYEAAEDNELSFPEGATITNVEFPDDDWWSGEYSGHVGLFPANYVELVQ